MLIKNVYICVQTINKECEEMCCDKRGKQFLFLSKTRKKVIYFASRKDDLFVIRVICLMLLATNIRVHLCKYVSRVYPRRYIAYVVCICWRCRNKVTKRWSERCDVNLCASNNVISLFAANI